MKKYILVLFTPFLLASNKQEKPSLFGKYDKPTLLQKLEDYQESGKANWEDLWFYISYDRHYSTTPLDVIPFAYTSYAGLHFGFLTDFGTIENLENAPIVSVAPTDDPAIQFIAPDLETFLSYVCHAKSSLLLVRAHKNEEEFEQKRREELNADSLFIKKVEKQIAILYKDLKVPILNTDLVTKMQQDRKARAALKIFETFDNIGVQLPNDEPITKFSYSKDIKKIDDFLKNSNWSSRIVFYRNATYAYVFGGGYNPKIKQKIIDYLKKDGFDNEARFLQELL